MQMELCGTTSIYVNDNGFVHDDSHTDTKVSKLALRAGKTHPPDHNLNPDLNSVLLNITDNTWN
jgi:hypothetical protein